MIAIEIEHLRELAIRKDLLFSIHATTSHISCAVFTPHDFLMSEEAETLEDALTKVRAALEGYQP